MGSKPSNAMPSNRPESGGADKDMRQEKSGLLEREKQEFAASQKAKEESRPRDAGIPEPDPRAGEETEGGA